MFCWLYYYGGLLVAVYTRIAGKISVTDPAQIVFDCLLAPGNFCYIYLSNYEEICDMNDELRERWRLVRISSLF